MENHSIIISTLKKQLHLYQESESYLREQAQTSSKERLDLYSENCQLQSQIRELSGQLQSIKEQNDIEIELLRQTHYNETEQLIILNKKEKSNSDALSEQKCILLKENEALKLQVLSLQQERMRAEKKIEELKFFHIDYDTLTQHMESMGTMLTLLENRTQEMMKTNEEQVKDVSAMEFNVKRVVHTSEECEEKIANLSAEFYKTRKRFFVMDCDRELLNEKIEHLKEELAEERKQKEMLQKENKGILFQLKHQQSLIIDLTSPSALQTMEVSQRQGIEDMEKSSTVEMHGKRSETEYSPKKLEGEFKRTRLDGESTPFDCKTVSIENIIEFPGEPDSRVTLKCLRTVETIPDEEDEVEAQEEKKKTLNILEQFYL